MKVSQLFEARYDATIKTYHVGNLYEPEWAYKSTPFFDTSEALVLRCNNQDEMGDDSDETPWVVLIGVTSSKQLKDFLSNQEPFEDEEFEIEEEERDREEMDWVFDQARIANEA